MNKEKWILERKYDLLTVPYFHVVFTLPAQLRSICYQNKKLIYNLLFTSAWETLEAFSNDPKQKLEAKMGMIAVLHTWTQQFLYHPHLHSVPLRVSYLLEVLMKMENGKAVKVKVGFCFM